MNFYIDVCIDKYVYMCMCVHILCTHLPDHAPSQLSSLTPTGNYYSNSHLH